MHPLAGQGAADPLTFAIWQGRSAIEAHGPLEQAPGAPSADPMHKSLVETGSLRLRYPLHHLQTGGPQTGDAPAGHPGIRIRHGHHHPCHSRRQDRIATGGRAALMTAGLQGHHQGAPPRPTGGLGQGHHLSMGFASAAVIALSHQLAVLVQHQGPHHRIGACRSGPEGGQGERPIHLGPPVHGRSPGPQSGKRSHSATT